MWKLFLVIIQVQFLNSRPKSFKGCTVWYPGGGGAWKFFEKKIPAVEAKKNFTNPKAAKKKQFNPTPNSGGEMVIFEEENFTHPPNK